MAAKDAHRELLATVDRHREQWAAKVAERIEQRRGAVRDALDAFEQAYQALREDVALRAWLDQFPEGRCRPGAGSVPALRRPSGDATAFATVIDALRQMVDPPEQPAAPNVEPLRPVAHAL